MIGALLVAALAAILGCVNWHRRERKAGKRGLGARHFLAAGLVGTWLFMTMTLGAAGWIMWRWQYSSAVPNSLSDLCDGPHVTKKAKKALQRGVTSSHHQNKGD